MVITVTPVVMSTIEEHPVSPESDAASTIIVAGQALPRIGFAGLHLAGPSGWGAPVDRAAAVALVRRAVELGVGLIDTADTLGPGASEEVIAEALHPYSESVIVSTKAGMTRTGPRGWGVLGRPDYLKQQAKTSALRLRLEPLPVFSLHRVDPTVPFDDQIGALVELRNEGVIEGIGLCAVTPEQLDAALAITPIAMVQNHYNLVSRAHEATLRRAEQLEIPFVAYWGIGQGRGLVEAPAVVAVADRLGATGAQVLIAWLLQRSPSLVAIPGTGNPQHLESNLEALQLRLDAEAIEALEAFAATSRPVPDIPSSPVTP